MFRIGHGYDVHPFAEGRELWLGGVNIPHHAGLEGHSDADVLLHALADALLGALALPDIGHLFPNTDERWRGADSKVLLAMVGQKVRESGYTISNVDTTLVAEVPKIAPYTEDMRKAIATALQLSTEQVGIKATTNEKLGFIGRQEGIAAFAVALLIKQDQG
jgi:2-C-methyl-D-erythritol 2,4-cyclodiphosphate synthase